MSNAVFPTMPGQGWGTVRTPVWATQVQASSSGRESRLAYMSYPLYRWKININVLRQYASFVELATLQAFFNTMSGMADTFLFTDPDDNTATAQGFGTGDGATVDFQLVRQYGGYAEPVQSPDAGLQVYDNGVLKTITTHYTVGATGIVHFLYTPVAGHALTWTGTFKYRARFFQDTYDFQQDYSGLWKAGTLQLQSVKQ